jgi:hypothetical protein
MPDLSSSSSPRWDDARLIAALGELRERLVVPDAPIEIDAGALSRPPSRRARHVLVAAAAVVVLIVLTASIAPARHAVADWLGLGATEVRVGEPPPDIVGPLPALDSGARVVDAEDAAAELRRPLPRITHPHTDETPVYAIPTEGGVLVRWPSRDETLWMRRGVDEARVYLRKFVQVGGDVAHIDGLGEDALWIGTGHVLETPGRALAASHVLLWITDGLELRLEGDQSRDEMVQLAHALIAG